MILTTTESVEGKHITAYLGIVSGEAVQGTNIFKDFFGSIRDVVGGRSGSYESEFLEAKNAALAELEERAQAVGADAVIGVDLDYQVLGGDQKMLLMVAANGTAVKLG
ncbi:YbjQ family protein [Rhodospirillum sp. A1_3_36]|uniref:YbjQ family protein n=1 Tax=Rhodospirillum sp. A1_3_36 TaxID=3391666 RepID=UPI0039A40582